MSDDSHRPGPPAGVPKFAAGSMVSPALQAALKASTDARFRPLIESLSKSLVAGLPRPELGAGVPKFAAGSMVSPALQAALKASTDARFRPLIESLSKSLVAGLPRPELGAGVPKFAVQPVLNAAIAVPAGRTVSERARFTDLLGQVGTLSPAGTDSEATLADLAQRQAAAHEADQAIVELRDQFEQLVTMMQMAQQDQKLEARANRRLAIATLAAMILLALLSYLFPPRSATTAPTPTAPPPSVTSTSSEGSTPRQVPPRPSQLRNGRSDTT